MASPETMGLEENAAELLDGRKRGRGAVTDAGLAGIHAQSKRHVANNYHGSH